MKIGRVEDLSTDSVTKRMLALNTSVPENFEQHYAMRVYGDVAQAERIMHGLFGHVRVAKKELFKIEPLQAKAAMELAEMRCDIIYDAEDPDVFNVKGHAQAKTAKLPRLKQKVEGICTRCGARAVKRSKAGKPITLCKVCAQLTAGSMSELKKNRAAVGAKRKPKA